MMNTMYNPLMKTFMCRVAKHSVMKGNKETE